ncbi:hypothetical protein R3Q06_29010 [Rhodococcus erythropolis]|uniref:hypothetical protein n=1 Tax=Rhodococcus erythropolis TaxID=1833 RepID=UPI002948D28D|nr:hypothetical protein [Rhodococcus erythropolis]MDV6277535.1 hypothetical protein [Rhodococcus erythropolis]
MATTSRTIGDGWLSTIFAQLLDEKYGHGRVPGVRKISADIAAANDGDTISHGHVHHILTGEADNLTDRTRSLLARYFGKPPSFFLAPSQAGDDHDNLVHMLAARLATFDSAQVAAIAQAVDMVTAHQDS